MSLSIVIIIIVVTVLISGLLLTAKIASQAAKAKQRPCDSPELPALDPRLAAEIKYQAVHTPKGKNTPPSLAITAPFVFPAPIIFSTESAMDRFGKAIGLASEVQTGDPLFDDAIYVNSPYPDYASRMLSDPDNRRAIRRCFAAVPKLNRLECSREHSRFIISPAEANEISDDTIRELLAALPGLKQSVNRVEISPSAFRENIGRVVIIATVLWGVLGFIALGIGLAAFKCLDNGIFIPGLLGGLIAWGVWVLLCFGLLKGRSGALLPWLLALVIGLGDFAILGIGTAHIANGVTATAPIVTHVVSVTGKYISRSKNSTSYYLEFQPWREGLDSSISVSSSWYHAVENGSPLNIDSRMGGLGYEMLVDYR